MGQFGWPSGRTWLDMDRYAGFSSEVDQLKAQTASFPELIAPWVSVLIAHTELMFCLWNVGQGSVDHCSEVQGCLRNHREAAEILRSACLRISEQ